MLEQQGHMTISEANDATLMPCSHQAECLAPLTAISPTKLNISLMPNETIAQLKDPVHSPVCPKDICCWPGQEAISERVTSMPPCSHKVPTADPISMLEQQGHVNVSKANEGALMPCSPKNELLALSTAGSLASDLISNKISPWLKFYTNNSSTKAQEDVDEGELAIEAAEGEKQPDQAAISKVANSLVNQMLACPLCSSSELESWLCWKPLDYGGVKQHTVSAMSLMRS